MNNITLVGRLVNEVELKAVSEKFTVGKFTLAVKDKYKKDSVSFINIEVYNKLAETICQYTHKGDQICLAGYLKVDNYTDKEGNKKSIAKVVVENFEFGSRKTNQIVNLADPEITPIDDSDVPF